MKWLAVVVSLGLAHAATTATWELNGYSDFQRGKIDGLSLTRDGRLIVGPKLDTLFTANQPEIWSIARGPDGSLYLGTGNRGRLFKVDATGQGSVIWTSDQPEIFAVAVDAKGIVYAGTSPDGKVYRIENGQITEYFAPQARYIWALLAAPDGSLYVGTGDQGRVYRVTGPGKAVLYYETGQSNVTALAMDREGRLLAGTDPNGILYRVTGPQKAFVLYDANLPEIRAIVPAPDGSIYTSALGGSVAKRTSAATNTSTTSISSLPTVSTSITVTEQAGITPVPAPDAPKATTTTSSAVASTTSTIEYTGVEKSALYRIFPDNTVETLWSSKEENVYDVALSGGVLQFLTDVQGRLYRLESDRKATLINQAGQGDATRLLSTSDGTYVTTGNLAKVLRVGNTPSPAGSFESPVHDAGSVARWGRLAWRGDAKVSFQTRAGNSARPDATWSDWSAAINDPEHASITSPNARYIQWRMQLSGPGGVDSATLAYLPQNSAPTVRSITVTGKSGSTASTATGSNTAAYSITVTDTGESSSAAGTNAQTISRGAGQQVQVAWQAEDPEGDKMIYSLYFRGEDESQWKLLRANMTENTYVLDGDVFADGRYYFRVTASDRPGNPVEFAREAELVSAPVLVDSTPPTISAGQPRRVGAGLELEANAEDRGSALRRCEYSIDAGPWFPVEAADGVTDSPKERFVIRQDPFPGGEHLLVIRVWDSAGNAGLTKVVVR